MITRDLLPSSAMVKDLSQELGLPISQEDLTEGKLLALPSQHTLSLEHFLSQKSTLAYEIQAHQEKYLQWRNTMVLKNKGQGSSLVQVGTLSSPSQGPQAFASTGAVQSLVGRYRVDDQFCICSPGIPGRVGKEYWLWD